MTIKEIYRKLLDDRKFVRSLLASLGFLFLALIINYFAALYAFERASNHVSDLVLSNLPTFNVDVVFAWGPLIFFVILAFFIFRDPRGLPFILKSIALFVIIRAFFITLTHLGPPPDQMPLLFGGNWIAEILNTNPTYSFIISSGADLFFSGHTGLPFLLALIFWQDIKLRVYCLAASIFFGIVVLLGHLHYSIDVASAFFITYGISHIANRAFRVDRDRFLAGYTQKN